MSRSTDALMRARGERPTLSTANVRDYDVPGSGC
jgi:hypothetical protein